jgi:hypothetical protein
MTWNQSARRAALFAIAGSIGIVGINGCGARVAGGSETGPDGGEAEGTTVADTGGASASAEASISSTAVEESSTAPGESTATAGESGGTRECPPLALDCDDPQPIVQSDGSPSGFERCSDGFVHRVAAVTCSVPTPVSTCETPHEFSECAAAADCVAQPYGACVQQAAWQGGGCECAYGCATDADCGAGSMCGCGDAIADGPRCIGGGCTTDADCAGLCGLDPVSGGCGLTGYLLACLDAGAECRTCCPEEIGCYDNPGEPRCDSIDGQWVCNIDSLCEDCG